MQELFTELRSVAAVALREPDVRTCVFQAELVAQLMESWNEPMPAAAAAKAPTAAEAFALDTVLLEACCPLVADIRAWVDQKRKERKKEKEKEKEQEETQE